MENMRLIRALKKAQEPLDVPKSLSPDLQLHEKEPTARASRPSSARESEANNFCTVFRNDLIENFGKPSNHRRFSDEIYAAAFIMRTMSSQTDAFLGPLIP
jgi:hypothetical protein